MSLLYASAWPSLPEPYRQLGAELTKSADVAYNLRGQLYADARGWLLLRVPAGLVRGVFAAMKEPGIELPPYDYDDDRFVACLTVMTQDETDGIGVDNIKERGQEFSYTLGRLVEFAPADWPGVEKVFALVVHSPELQKLRLSYGLTALPHRDTGAFHVPVAVLKRGVLGRTATSRTAR